MGELSPSHIWQINPTAAQAQTQGYDLDGPVIHLIYDLLEHVKGPDLQTQSCRIATTQGNNRIPRRSPSLCNVCMLGAQGSQKKVSDPLDLELQMVVNCHVGGLRGVLGIMRVDGLQYTATALTLQRSLRKLEVYSQAEKKPSKTDIVCQE
ncbi:hypothetical protein STEG23_038294, partial [Scotinomys teguina]